MSGAGLLIAAGALAAAGLLTLLALAGAPAPAAAEDGEAVARPCAARYCAFVIF